MTAVRRVDAGKSPMTKVMDLFRHRSNSAVSEADKRKAVSCFFFYLQILFDEFGFQEISPLGLRLR